MTLRRSPSYCCALLLAVSCLAAPAFAQTQPPTNPTQPSIGIAQPPTPNTRTAPTNPTAPAVPTAPANPNTASPSSTNPNPQVGPNAVAQNQPNLAFRAPASNRNFSTARVPNMIGDLTGGGGASIVTTGFVSQSVTPPSLNHGRLNVAENNSPIVGDRVFFTYRHFENASDLDYLNGLPNGGSASQSIDRYLFGFERMLTDTSSLEFRLPLNSQLGSDLQFAQLSANQTSVPFGATDFELGNISFILKQALIDRSGFYLSAGLGLNLPTAPDVSVRTRITDQAFPFFDFSRKPPVFLGTDDLDYGSQTVIKNETVNLTPYLSFAYRPGERTFMQGFLQYDVPLNNSEVRHDQFFLAANGPAAAQSFRGRLDQQTLMRANVGAGRWLRYRNNARYFHSIAAMFEVHYTTALDNADVVGPFRLATTAPQTFTSTSVGNVANRFDIVNLTAGVPMIVGRTTVTNAFTVPVRGDLNRGFDFEYSLLIDRRF